MDEPGSRQYDGYLMLVCPFHNDHKPSLMVFPDRKFKCLGCGEWGRWEKLDAKLNGSVRSPFTPATLAPNAAPSLDADLETVAMMAHDHLKRYNLGAYLKRRHVDTMIDKCLLGWHEGWFTVPAFEEDGSFAGMSLRASPAVQEVSGMRHFIPPGQPATVFVPGRWASLEEAERVYVVFGIFDALVMAAANYPVVTVIGGHKAYNPKLFDRIRKPLDIIPDRDEQTNLSTQLGWRGTLIGIDWPAHCKDVADLVEQGYNLKEYIP